LLDKTFLSKKKIYTFLVFRLLRQNFRFVPEAYLQKRRVLPQALLPFPIQTLFFMVFAISIIFYKENKIIL